MKRIGIGFDYGHGDKSVAAIRQGGTVAGDYSHLHEVIKDRGLDGVTDGVRYEHSCLREVIQRYSPAIIYTENFETYDAVEHNACMDLALALGTELRCVHPRITALRHKDWGISQNGDEVSSLILLLIAEEGVTQTNPPTKMTELPPDTPEGRVMARRRDPNRNVAATFATYLPPAKECPFPALLIGHADEPEYSTRVEFFILAALESNSRPAYEALIQCRGAGKKGQWRSEFYFGLLKYYLNREDGFHPQTGLKKHFVERERRKGVMKQLTKAVRWIYHQTRKVEDRANILPENGQNGAPARSREVC